MSASHHSFKISAARGRLCRRKGPPHDQKWGLTFYRQFFVVTAHRSKPKTQKKILAPFVSFQSTMKLPFSFLLLCALVHNSHGRISVTKAPQGSKAPKASKSPKASRMPTITTAATTVNFIDTPAEIQAIINNECTTDTEANANICNNNSNFGNGQQGVMTYDDAGSSPFNVAFFCCTFLPDDPLFDIPTLLATSFCTSAADVFACSSASPDGSYTYIPTSAGDIYFAAGICCQLP